MYILARSEWTGKQEIMTNHTPSNESKDTDLQHHLRNVWHDNFNEQEFIDEMEAYITRVKLEAIIQELEYLHKHTVDIIPDMLAYKYKRLDRYKDKWT